MPDGFDYGNMTPDMDEEVEEDVKRDMHLQRTWCEIMKPMACMLKFRLPYTGGETKYLDGDIHFQAFAAETSSECRLIISKEKHKYTQRVYNHEQYENYMYRFNRCTRVQPIDAFADGLGGAIDRVIAKLKDAKELFEPTPMSYDVLTLGYVVQQYIDACDSDSGTLIGEIIYCLDQYISTSFQRKYKLKKTIHDKHMEQNKAKYESGSKDTL
jgi:hypothetical protein